MTDSSPAARRTTRSWTRGVTVASVLLVALVAAVVSYAHVHDLAERAGEGWRGWLIPLAVDGMLLATTLAIVERRRVRLPAGWVPWLGLVLGLVGSLGANVAAARADLVAQLVAAWPPIALAVSIETLVIVLRGPGGDAADHRSGTAGPARSETAALGPDRSADRISDRRWTGGDGADQEPDRQAENTPDRASGHPGEARSGRAVRSTDHPLTSGDVADQAPDQAPDWPGDDADRAPDQAPDHTADDSDQSEAEPPRPPIPLVANDEHLPAVQALADRHGRRPTRRAVRELTGVGATRADRLRHAVIVEEATG